MKNFSKFTALGLSKFNKLTAQIETKAVDTFNKSIEIAKIVREGWNWYRSLSAKDREEQGIAKFTAEEFAVNVYGLKKVMFYRYLNAAEVSAEVVAEFTKKTLEAKDKGRYASLSLVDLVDYNHAKETAPQGGGEGEGEGEGEGGGEPEVGKAQTIFTLSWKRDDGNVAVRIDENGNVTTKNTPDDIRAAIALLSKMLPSA